MFYLKVKFTEMAAIQGKEKNHWISKFCLDIDDYFVLHGKMLFKS